MTNSILLVGSVAQYAKLMLGQTLGGRYHIIRPLGGGSFGQTYLAEDRHLPGTHLCVVKQLKPATTAPPVLQIARCLFEREAQVLYKLGNHPQIPRLFAHFEENQEFYLVQEFIDGRDLSHELTPGKRLSEAEAIALLQNILEILAFIHQHNVIHRDIKPSNLIRRQQDNKIVVIDFGAVKQISTQVMNSQGEMTKTIAIGTPGYMPKEQLAGNPRFSSDIYAVGMIGIQALTGLRPNQLPESPNTSEIIWRDQVQVNYELAEIIDTMVRYDFRQRYQSVVEVLQAFNANLVPTELKSPAASTNQLITLETDALSSAVGIDYRTLRDLLAAEQWKKADEETAAVMLKVGGREKEGCLRMEDIEKFPCPDLHTIDQLWLKYSNKRFGFSVQKRIWQSVRSTNPADYVLGLVIGNNNVADSESCIDFANRVGWRVKDSWIDYSGLMFSKDAPEGQFPFFSFFEQVWRIKLLGVWELHSAIATAGWWRLCVCLFSRVEDCNL